MKLQIGDNVQYSRNFLRSCGMYTGKIPFAMGIITDIKSYGGKNGMSLAVINWNDPEIPEKVNIKNLHKVGKPEIE